MPRRRTTRTATKRPSPTLPDGDDSSTIEMERGQRKEKVEALLKDFQNEVDSRISNLRLIKSEMVRQIDLAYTMELMRLKPEHRSMKLVDYLAMKKAESDGAAGGDAAAAALPVFSSFLSVHNNKTNSSTTGSSGKPEPSAATTEAVEPATTRKTRGKKTTDEAFVVPQTSRRVRGQKRTDSMVTPAVSRIQMSSMATPLVTPKFDPRLYQTPAVTKRVVRPGEVIMSIDGSPIEMHSNDTFVVPINRTKSIVVRNESELQSLDPSTALAALRRLEEMKLALQAVVDLKPRAT